MTDQPGGPANPFAKQGEWVQILTTIAAKLGSQNQNGDWVYRNEDFEITWYKGGRLSGKEVEGDIYFFDCERPFRPPEASWIVIPEETERNLRALYLLIK